MLTENYAVMAECLVPSSVPIVLIVMFL